MAASSVWLYAGWPPRRRPPLPAPPRCPLAARCSKAFGCLGGFVACSRQWKDFLANRGRAQVYSTARPVPVVASALAALRVARQEPWRRRHVWALAERLGAALGIPATSPIVPLVIGPEAAAVGASMALLQRHGMHVPAIRPPTVPAGTSRLRISLSAAHSEGDVDQLVAALRTCGLRFQALLAPAPVPRAAAAAVAGEAEGAEQALQAGTAAAAALPLSRL